MKPPTKNSGIPATAGQPVVDMLKVIAMANSTQPVLRFDEYVTVPIVPARAEYVSDAANARLEVRGPAWSGRAMATKARAAQTRTKKTS
jgi:hypothetical protein